MRICTFAVLSLIAAAGLGGCNGNLEDENALLLEENNALRRQLEERAGALDDMYDQVQDKDRQLAQLRRELDETPVQNNPFGDIRGVKGSATAGEVTALIESDLLFDSGKATLKSSAKRALAEVARVIRREYSDQRIRVAGHTDSDPIKKSGYKSNHHLGFERAFAVRQFLISEGIPARHLYIASHGPDQARSTKQQSRRVEIAVILNERIG